MMIKHIDTRSIDYMIAQPKPDYTGQSRRESDMDVTLEVSYRTLVEKAMTDLKTNSQAVQEAKKILSSGQWDSPDKIHKTAESILQFGI